MYKIISRTLILITALFLVTSIELSAQDLTFFDNQDSFNKTCPFLAVEDFEDTNAPPNVATSCTGDPLNSLTNDNCYSTGALIPGFSISDAVFNMAVATPNFQGITNVAVGPGNCSDDIVITFPKTIGTGVVNAVGMVIVSVGNNTTVDVQVFVQGNVFLGTATVNVTPINGTFLGVLTEGGEQITRIELVETGTPQCDALYELSFGQCGEIVRNIPTLSEWGLIAMAGVLGIVGFMVIRRRKVTA